ncbi:MAG: LysR family transcriptional regulator [Rhodanobacteraceae bacterium]|nr:MAG: LysR family transcriptional regulator [Rhodanobacteraceae bacterium]
MKRLPELEAWAIFAKVAELGAFSRAATELSLSQATVSKAVARLEQRIGSALFQRTSRRLVLTASGRAALERATRILEEGVAVEAEMTEQSATLRGLIRLTAPMSFGIARLGPLLPAFITAYPDIELDVQLNDEVEDLIANRYDLALRIASLADSSLHARRLCTVRVLLVGAPAYFRRHGMPKRPSDLRRHRVLAYTYLQSGSAWRFHRNHRAEVAAAPATPLRANNGDLFTPALLAGLGLALQPEFLVWQGLRDGTLQIAMPDWSVDALGLFIVTPPIRQRPARVQALIDFLAERLPRQPGIAG